MTTRMRKGDREEGGNWRNNDRKCDYAYGRRENDRIEGGKGNGTGDERRTFDGT